MHCDCKLDYNSLYNTSVEVQPSRPGLSSWSERLGWPEAALVICMPNHYVSIVTYHYTSQQQGEELTRFGYCSHSRYDDLPAVCH